MAHDDMTLDELAEAAPQQASEEMPANLREMLESQTGLFVESAAAPQVDVTPQPVPGVSGVWRIPAGDIRTTIPGREQTESAPGPAMGEGPDTDTALGSADAAALATEGYRPPWVDVDPLPRLAPFRAPSGSGLPSDHVYYEPLPRSVPTTRASEAVSFSWPWRLIGKVFSSGGPGGGEGGSGVLVGPNLILTASHVAPWGATGGWSMQFFPGYRMGQTPGLGSSFVEQFRGVRTEPEASGLDYVICKLYSPLGNAHGWMGTQSWGNEDEYYNRRFIASGYPDTFGGRAAVEFDVRVVDIDNDGDGLEIELPIHLGLTDGWSGGPLWFMSNGAPICVGVQSGSEKDGFDPRRHVTAGGRHMVDLVRFGLANWRP